MKLLLRTLTCVSHGDFRPCTDRNGEPAVRAKVLDRLDPGEPLPSELYQRFMQLRRDLPTMGWRREGAPELNQQVLSDVVAVSGGGDGTNSVVDGAGASNLGGDRSGDDSQSSADLQLQPHGSQQH